MWKKGPEGPFFFCFGAEKYFDISQKTFGKRLDGITQGVV
jgi:hypothetical protein